ncbi:hypothetical protein D3C72_1288920 [compost metagenome]
MHLVAFLRHTFVLLLIQYLCTQLLFAAIQLHLSGVQGSEKLFCIGPLLWYIIGTQ